jgi:hypothetical protein
MYKSVMYMFIAAFMIVSAASEADAGKGFYLGVGIPYNTIEGDFKGNSALEGGNEVIILPDIDGALGINVLMGYGFTRQWAIELNFLGSGHDGNWMGSAGNVDFFSFSINGKYNFPSSGATQPYLLFGISGNSLNIQDGSQNLWTGEIGDATLSGPGFNLGGGVEHYFRKMSLRLGVTYRFVDYTDAEGVSNSGGIEDSLDGSGFTVMVSTAYHF